MAQDSKTWYIFACSPAGYSLTLSAGVSLNKNLQRSLAWSTSQREVATLISESYPVDIVAKWRRMRADFDLNPSMPNPYKEVERRTVLHLPPSFICLLTQSLDFTIAELQKELLNEAKHPSAAHVVSVADAPSPSVSPGTFFQKAIEVEDRMYVLSSNVLTFSHRYLFSRVLSAKSASKVSTVRHQVDSLELQNTVSRNLAEFRRSQRIFMPALGPILDDACDDEPTEDSFKLFLPSELSVDDRVAWCPPDTPALEFRFRYAQADDSLAEMHRLLRLNRNLRDENSKHLHMAQRSLTRTKGLFESFHTRIHRFANRYSHARNAMLALDPDQRLSPGWMNRFRELDGKDIRGPGREENDTSEGQFKPLWIWLVPHLSHPSAVSHPPASSHPPAVSHPPAASPSNATTPPVNESAAASNPEVADSMRAHWAKCQARAERYEEEVSLTVEEMGRILSYFEWKWSWWLSLQSARESSDSPPPASVQHGLRAYAHRQAKVYEILIYSFANKWRKSLDSHKLSPAWLSRYPATANPYDHPQPETEPKSTDPPPPLPLNNDASTPPADEMDTGDNDHDNDHDEDHDNHSNDDGDDGNNSNNNYVVDDAEAFKFDFDDDLTT